MIEPVSPRVCRLTLLWADPLVEERPWWPSAPGKLRPAFDVYGKPLEVDLLDAWSPSWLIGGSSGSGKSAVVNSIVADLVRQDHVEIVAVDPKVTELTPWRPALRALATTRQEADEILVWARRQLDARVADLADAGLRSVPGVPTEEWPALVIVVDEVAALLADDRGRTDRRRVLRTELAQLGRAGGLVLVLATQRPSTDAVPPQLTNNIGRRVLTRPASLDHAAIIAGHRPTQADLDALTVPGLAWWFLPGRRPVLARSTYGTVADVEGLAAAYAVDPWSLETTERR